MVEEGTIIQTGMKEGCQVKGYNQVKVCAWLCIEDFYDEMVQVMVAKGKARWEMRMYRKQLIWGTLYEYEYGVIIPLPPIIVVKYSTFGIQSYFYHSLSFPFLNHLYAILFSSYHTLHQSPV